LAIIDSLTIEFSPGFNVITGETGAGKSILIRALHFLMGAKAGSDSVRQGSSQATVTGEFSVPRNHPALGVLQELGIPFDDSDEVPILVRRQLTAKGRSQSWVNDTTVTSPSLRELGMTLVDVFGQHENQRLMEVARHVDYLDAFLADSRLRDRYRQANAACTGLWTDLRALVDKIQDRSRNSDYLSFRLDALGEFAPSVEDYERTVEFCRSAERSVMLRESMGRALQCLDGDGEAGTSKALWEASRLLGQAATHLGASAEASDPATPPETPDEQAGTLAELQDRAARVATELDDLTFDLGKQVSRLECDEGELEAAQNRLFGYQDWFRKTQVRGIEPLVAEWERLRAELETLNHASERIGERVIQWHAACRQLGEAAEMLGKARREAAGRLKGRIEDELHELAMPGARFETEFNPAGRTLAAVDLGAFGEDLVSLGEQAAGWMTATGETGAERAQFLLASNQGESMLPLARVASGGELSRVLLSLKKALAADAETCVLVFDEIDTGVSGRVADVVGRKIRELAGSFQVICISHLPQVAVYADSHFLVRKEDRGERTESSIVRLSREESAREIARLLSGAEVSSPSLANAKSLIERAKGETKRSTAERAKGKAKKSTKDRSPARTL
jgi:DNA repair protein RecN (Recombination protein N)